MSNPHQSIVNAYLGTQSKNIEILWGKFLKFEREGKQICMVFSKNRWIPLGSTTSYQLAHNLVHIFNGTKQKIELANDEFASQRTGIYDFQSCTQVIEKARNPQQLGGNLLILDITSDVSYRKAERICKIIVEILNNNSNNCN